MAPGLSAKELGRLAGVASTLPTMIEHGSVASPRIDTLEKLAAPLGVSASWLAFGEGDAPDPAAVRAAVEAARARAVAEAAEHTPTEAAA
jgi:transcriptional regulator with XRE-family HTH domain